MQTNVKKLMWLMGLFLVAIMVIGAAATQEVEANKEKSGQEHDWMSYLDNDIIRLGVDLHLGGSITYLSESNSTNNIVNNYDWGRQIQMSFYSGPNPFTPGGKKPARLWETLGWNPIQSGDYAGNRSRVIDYQNDGKTLYVKCIPMHWPLDNEPAECTYECWIRLEANTAHIRSRINNHRSDKTQYKGRGSEVPAIYTNGPLYRLMSYTGDKPFTGDELTQFKKVWLPPKVPEGGVWNHWQATENWAALVQDDDWGLGVWKQGNYSFMGGFAGTPGKGGTKDFPTGYMSPTQTEILDHNIQYEYSYVLILGRLEEIRKYVYDHAERKALPDYRFENDRQHWHYVHTQDTGWPIRGELHVLLEGDDPQMVGPSEFWLAEDVPKLYIRAAYRTRETRAQIFWKTHGSEFSDEKSLQFDIRPDGKYHTYELDLASCPHYKGAITGLRFDPVESGQKGDYIKVKFISCRSE